MIHPSRLLLVTGELGPSDIVTKHRVVIRTILQTSRIQNRPLMLIAFAAVTMLWHMAGTVSNSDPPHSGDLFFYHVRLSHYGPYGPDRPLSSFNYTKDPALSWGVEESDWQYAMTRGMVESLLTGFYALLDLTSTTHVKDCPTVNLHLKLDYSVEVSSPDCEAIPLDLP